MSELYKFIFDGMPVRGMWVRLDADWQEVLRRRTEVGAWSEPVRRILGEMSAAATLMQASIKFNGALVLQIQGDGPLKLAAVEVQPDLEFRATAKVLGEVSPDADLTAMANVTGRGRCALTLDPADRPSSQSPYQGVVPLQDEEGQPLTRLSDVLSHYMRQSEQLETTLVLASDDQQAVGLLIQRMPVEGGRNLGQSEPGLQEDDEDYNRISRLAQTLKREEMLTLDAHTILRRLFWEEPLRLFEPQQPRFQCRCSRGRVAQMLRSLGAEEVQSVLEEQGRIDVTCEFCGLGYSFDAIDARALFEPSSVEGSDRLH